MNQGAFECAGEFYTASTKETVTVLVDGFDHCVSFQSRHIEERINNLWVCDWTFIKRGWLFTDFQLKLNRISHHSNQALTGEVYKLTFWNAAGDKVRQVIDHHKESIRRAREEQKGGS